MRAVHSPRLSIGVFGVWARSEQGEVLLALRSSLAVTKGPWGVHGQQPVWLVCLGLATVVV